MTGSATPYRGRTAALATRHGKRPLIAAPLTALGLRVILADGVDTDRFGTFTGDRVRTGSARDTVEAKARAALASAALPLGLASEGSFGPHPASHWVTLDVELVALVDDDTDLVVVGRASSTDATWASHPVAGERELHGFLASIGFPRQGVVVHTETHPADAVKGITDLRALHDAIAAATLCHPDQLVQVVTDLRAHHNPRRRAVIRAAAADLAARLASHCPACSSPGYGTERGEPGRPCATCGTPTHETAALIWSCPACRFEHCATVTGYADPTWCPQCNP